jgi:hypothetical protein
VLATEVSFRREGDGTGDVGVQVGSGEDTGVTQRAPSRSSCDAVVRVGVEEPARLEETSIGCQSRADGGVGRERKGGGNLVRSGRGVEARVSRGRGRRGHGVRLIEGCRWRGLRARWQDGGARSLGGEDCGLTDGRATWRRHSLRMEDSTIDGSGRRGFWGGRSAEGAWEGRAGDGRRAQRVGKTTSMERSAAGGRDAEPAKPCITGQCGHLR